MLVATKMNVSMFCNIYDCDKVVFLTLMALDVTAAATGNTDTDMMEDGFVQSVRHSETNVEKIIQNICFGPLRCVMMPVATQIITRVTRMMVEEEALSQKTLT